MQDSPKYYYPRHENPKFEERIFYKKEFHDNAIQLDYPSRTLNNYQYLASNYINPETPYSSLLLHYSTGVGKTLSAISTAENFIRKDPNFKVFVLTKNTAIENSFKQQLIRMYPGFASPEDLAKINNKDLNIEEHYLKKVNRNYNFIHFEAFKNRILGVKERNLQGMRKRGSLIDVDNSLIIIDEVHNLIGNQGYEAVYKVLSYSKNTRLLILSATPVYDKIQEVFEISNILNFNNPRNQFNMSRLLEDGMIEQKNEFEEISIFNDEKLYRITEKGKAMIKETLKHKVLYLKTDISNFPEYIEMGQHLSYPGYNFTSVLKVILCPMGDYQEKYYDYVLYTGDGSWKTYKKLEDASSIAYPQQVKKFQDLSRYLTEDKVYTYSTKLYFLLQNIKRSRGKVFIYSSLVNKSGVELIAKCLKANDITFTTITSNIEPHIRNRRLMSFNSPTNMHGEKTRVLIGSKVMAEGLTLKEVRQVHVYEPFWNLSGIDQVIGRAIRNNSHARLPLHERTVEIYKYCATGKDMSLSIDASKYIKSERKDIYIKEIERIIAKSSFGCFLNKDRNVIKRIGKYQDGTRECDYATCHYTCNWEPSSSVKANQPKPIDYSTYNVRYNDIEKFLSISKDIIKVLSYNQLYSFEDLMLLFKKYDDLSLKQTLDYLVNNYYINRYGNYYTSRDLKKNSSNYVSSRSTNSGSASLPQEFGFDVFMKNGVFAIKTKKSAKGKACTSYTKKELESMVKKITEGINVKQMTKQELCTVLENRLI